jgi:hypothetical protein
MIEKSERPIMKVDQILNLIHTKPIYDLSAKTEMITAKVDSKSFKNVILDFLELPHLDHFFISLLLTSYNQKILNPKTCGYDLSFLIKLLSINNRIFPHLKPEPEVIVERNQVIRFLPSELIYKSFEIYFHRLQKEVSIINGSDFFAHDKLMCDQFLMFCESFDKDHDKYLTDALINILRRHHKFYSLAVKSRRKT